MRSGFLLTKALVTQQIIEGAAMPKMSILLLPLIAGAAPAIAQTATPLAASPVSITGTIERPTDLGCMMRMMDLIVLTKRVARDEKRSAEDRQRALSMSYDADAAFFYYAGRLGKDYFKTSRSSEGEAEFRRMRANPREQQSKEMAVCIADTMAARKEITSALASPAK